MKSALNTWLCSTSVIALLVGPSALAQTNPSGEKVPASTAPFVDEAPTKEQCIESHRECQEVQKQGKLLYARELARTCTNSTCPGLLVSDCARWLSDLDQRIPSVVFEVHLDGEPRDEATITADGKPVTEWTNGEPLRLDPGKHQFHIELANHPPSTQNVILAEGMRFRVVNVEFKSTTLASAQPSLAAAASTPAATPPAPHARPTPFIVYPLLGVAVLGAAGFGTFALMGNAKENDLSNTCKPYCTEGEKKPMKTDYLIGDISLGVGVASLITASVFYFTRPEKAVGPSVAVTPLHGGGAGYIGYRF